MGELQSRVWFEQAMVIDQNLGPPTSGFSRYNFIFLKVQVQGVCLIKDSELSFINWR